jgi:hypothetical protein
LHAKCARPDLTALRHHGALLRLWLSTLLGVITERTTAPQRPTIFMVDELAQLGGLRVFKEAVTLLRGYGLRCCLFLQSHAQLKSLYPIDHEAITDNCGAIVTFGHTSMGMSRQIADMLGDITAEALFAMTGEQIAVHIAWKPTVIARRLITSKTAGSQASSTRTRAIIDLRQASPPGKLSSGQFGVFVESSQNRAVGPNSDHITGRSTGSAIGHLFVVGCGNLTSTPPPDCP